MSVFTEPEEISGELPPSFATAPSELHRRIQLVEGSRIDLNLTLYNTGTASVGLAVYVVGDAVSNSYVTAGMVRAFSDSFTRALEAPLQHRRHQGDFIFEAHLWEQMPGGGPPESIILPGLTLPPPFLCHDPQEVALSERHWGPRAVHVHLRLFAVSAGSAEAEIWIVPPSAPTEGIIITLDLDISPE